MGWFSTKTVVRQFNCRTQTFFDSLTVEEQQVGVRQLEADVDLSREAVIDIPLDFVRAGAKLLEVVSVGL